MALTKPYLKTHAYRIARTLYELSITHPGEYYTATEISRLITSYYNHSNRRHRYRLDTRGIAYLIRNGVVDDYAVLDTRLRAGKPAEYRFVSGACPELHAQTSAGGDA